MEPLNETHWDVVIDGTGVQQSLLALALSRSNKKVLHVDRNDYYGASEAAFSLQEAEEWVKRVKEGDQRCFPSATISQPKDDEGSDEPKLSFSRAYTLTLSPQIIYTRSKLLSQLVSSKVYKQLEFQAVGSWWLYSKSVDSEGTQKGQLSRMPSGREDIFTDNEIDNRSKRALMKFLKFVVDYEEQQETWEPHAKTPLMEFLSEQFKLPENLRVVVLALTLSLDTPADTNVEYSLPRIARHLTSIGLFGPGFGSVYPKWGGGAEIAQVACRAGAVGGGIYVLGSGIKATQKLAGDSENAGAEVILGNGEVIKTRSIVTTVDEERAEHGLSGDVEDGVRKMITIIASPLASLFESNTEGSPSAAISVAVFPSGTLSSGSQVIDHPVYIMAHSADTGECPQDQTVLYVSTKSPESALNAAVSAFLKTFATDDSPSIPKILYTLNYTQIISDIYTATRFDSDPKSCKLPTMPMDLAFSDETLDRVEEAWKMVMGLDGGGQEGEAKYMDFEEREGMNDDEDDGY